MYKPQYLINNPYYYMASSISGQDEPNRVLWLATWRARWSYLTHSGLPAVSRKKNFPESHIINPLLTNCLVKMAQCILASFFFCDFTSVHKHAKKELGQCPAILTSHLVNNPHYSSFTRHLKLEISNLDWIENVYSKLTLSHTMTALV